MQYVFDLTGKGSGKLQYFPDVVAAFAVPTTLEKSLSLLVWGIVFPEPHQDPDFCSFLPSSVQGSLPTALYLSGWGVLTFHEATRGELTVWPYEPSLPFVDLKLPEQEGRNSVILTQTWGEPSQDGTYQYLFSMVLEQPLGFMALKMNASTVTLSVCPQDFITEEQLIKAPEVYPYDFTRTRQLQSLLRQSCERPWRQKPQRKGASSPFRTV